MVVAELGYKSTITIESEPLRPCVVRNEKDALFHRWIFEDDIICSIKALMHRADKFRIEREYRKKSGVIVTDDMTTITPVRKTLGLVEYKDGTMDKVNPIDIRFMDTLELMSESASMFPSEFSYRTQDMRDVKERYYIGKDFNTKDWFVYDNETDTYICWEKTEQACNEFVEKLKGE